jgi:NAD kinase
MESNRVEYAIVVRSKTRLESLIERFNTKAQAQFYIERQGGDFSDYISEHESFHDAFQEVQAKLSTVVKYKVIERAFLPSFIFSPKNIVIVVGQDGLVANTAKYSREIPIVAVNPDTNRYDGVLLPFTTNDFLTAVAGVVSNQFQFETMHFAEACLNDGQRLLAFNDLFIGASSHISARYKIRFKETTEEQSSSGVIVSTKAGSTGWLSSVFNMAYGVAGLFEHALAAKHPKLKNDQLMFAVREPFQSIRTQTGIVSGVLHNDYQLVIESLMPDYGVIFSDGIEKDFLKFNSGAIATIGLAKENAKLVVNK